MFLDEPTIGLDVVAKERVRDFLTRINRERGVTVLLTTHDLADIERLCSRILMIDHGTLIYDGTVDDLIERYGGERTLVVDLEAAGAAARRAGAAVVKVDGPRQWLRFRRGETSAAQFDRRGRGAGSRCSTSRSRSPTSKTSSAGSTRAPMGRAAAAAGSFVFLMVDATISRVRLPGLAGGGSRPYCPRRRSRREQPVLHAAAPVVHAAAIIAGTAPRPSAPSSTPRNRRPHRISRPSSEPGARASRRSARRRRRWRRPAAPHAVRARTTGGTRR